MNHRFSTHHRHSPEDGYTLVAAMFLLFIFTIGLSVAVPAVSRQIQLDRERETVERGKQYQRAIQLYYRRFHAYPPTLDALIETNNIRFLRKRYIDPMTRKDDWRPILFGQNKAPTAMGFFGQPLTGIGSTGSSTLAGIGPNGSGGAGPSSDNSNSLLNSGFGPPMNGNALASSTYSGNSGSPGFGMSATSGQSSLSSTAMNPNAQTFGGAGIIGVSPASSGTSIMAYRKKDRYDEWEFTYDPMTDIALMRNNAVVNQPSVGSLVGNGTGSDGTGPMASPSLNDQGTGSVPQQ